MVMPKKYQNEAEKMTAALAIQRLVKEIKQISGLTWEQISVELEVSGQLKLQEVSSDLLRQYAGGKKPASNKKQLKIALAAEKCGWAGPVVIRVLQYFADGGAAYFGMPEQKYLACKKSLDQIDRYDQKARRLAVERVKRAISSLMAWGYPDTAMVYMVAALIEEATPESEKSGRAGMVDPGRLPFYRESDLQNAPLCVSWQISNWMNPESKRLLLGLPE